MSFVILNDTYDSDYYAPLSGFSGLFSDTIAPDIYAQALGSTPWTVDEFNFYMQLMRAVIESWDRSGWQTPTPGCWRLYPEKREAWKRFMVQFSTWSKRGYIPLYSYVSSAEEMEGRSLLRQLRTWGVWFDRACSTVARRATMRSGTRLSGFGGLFGELGVLPALPYIIGGSAIVGGAVVSALNTGWGVQEYAYWMRLMDETLHAWDTSAGAAGCWKKYPAERTRWLSFWKRFSLLFGRGIPSTFVSDDEEKAAKLLLAELRDWGTKLNNLCKAGTGPIGPVDPNAPPEPPPDGPADLGTTLKWGALVVAGILGLNLIQSVRSVTR